MRGDAVGREGITGLTLVGIKHVGEPTIEARRVEQRHGALALVRATFTGLLALPAPAGSEWWDRVETAKRCRSRGH